MKHETRRPQFLAGLQEQPTPQSPRFTNPAARTAPGASRGSPGLGTGDAFAPPPVDQAELRREVMERLGAAVATLRAHAHRLAEQARSDSIEIGFQVARKILETELHQSPEALFALVRSAVRRAGDSRRLVVRVAPDDLPLLQSEQARAQLDGLSAARIEYVADSSLQHGDCVVDADFGQVDGRLSTRLTEIRRAVDAAATEDVG